MNQKPILKLVAAISRDNIIGINNRLPWQCKNEMTLFKAITLNQFPKPTSLSSSSSSSKLAVVMGRKTFQSLNYTPLIDRENIIISKTLKPNGTYKVFPGLDNAMEYIQKSQILVSYIIGGHEIYKECLERGLCSTLYISRMKFIVKPSSQLFQNDRIVHFPKIPKDLYSFAGTLVYNKQFNLEKYIWSSEYCEALSYKRRQRFSFERCQ